MPFVPGDQVTVVGGNMSGTVVPSQLLSNGSLQLTISQAIQKADQYSWVFKIPFGGVAASGNGTATLPNGNATTTYSATGAPATQTVNAGSRLTGSLTSVGLAIVAAGFMML